MKHAKIDKNALFLIDGSYFLYRSYFALPPLHTASGHPTNATYAFFRTINKIIKDYNPNHLVIVWDHKGGSSRKTIYEDYKANRQAPPTDLFTQKSDILEISKLMDICTLEEKGYEADDLIGSLALKHKGQVVIISADKDMFQLLQFPHIIIFDPFKNQLVTADDYTAGKGFPPEKAPFYYALLGDTSDNIPGVAGIGKKTALELVSTFDSLDNLYKNLDSITKARVRNALEENRENAYLSYQLFLLEKAPITLTAKDTEFAPENMVKALPLFEELECKSLVKELQESFHFSVHQHGHKDHKAVEWECIIISTLAQLEELITTIKKKKLFTLDTETTGTSALSDELVGLSFAYDNKSAFYIPFGHPADEAYPQLDRITCLEQLRDILESSKIHKYMHHAKFDELVLWGAGITVEGTIFDSLIAANIVRREWQKINLKDLSSYYLNERMETYKEVVGTKRKHFGEVPIEQAARYSAHDSLQTFKLCTVLQDELEKEPTLKKFFYHIEMPLYHVLLAMEEKGITLDVDALADINKKVSHELTTIEHKIRAAVPDHHHRETLNLNSPQQLQHLLFIELKLPEVKRSKKGARSTDHEVLEELSKLHPVPGLILRYRELHKLKTTYLEPLPTFVNQKTGRIHSTFSQTITATGRLSSSNPNLQNIPAYSELGIGIRSAFVAPRGWRFLSADYSQIELRILAHLSGDKNLLNTFLSDKDIHAQTASQLFGVPVDEVTGDQRHIGKRVNFGIMYGQTPYGLSMELGIKPKEAKEYIERYFATYPYVAAWMEKTIKEATTCGYVESLWGKRRYIPELHEKNHVKLELGKRLAVNSPVQSTQADLIKIAMINIHKRLLEENYEARLILQIHDELILETPTSELEKIEKIVRYEMEHVVSWNVPITVSMRHGKDWGEVTK